MPAGDGIVDADLIVVGGGPAGLALAIAAALERLHVLVLERRPPPLDKACGEGVLPPALRALDALGALDLVDPADCAPIDGIRYVQEDGVSVEGRLPGPALGIRRLALVDGLRRRALALGVELRDRCTVFAHRRVDRGIVVETDEGPRAGRLLAAADGLASPLRRAAGLDRPEARRRRFGVRAHVRLPPWSHFVEVHFAPGAEGYVTPAGRDRVGVAFLWEPDGASAPATFETLLDRFPAIRERIAGAPWDSRVRGAGPLERHARARVADRLLLIGDAAGYVDAISGEGLSLAFGCATELAPLLPLMIAGGATAESLRPYERIFARHFRRYARVTGALLALSRRPRLRRAVLDALHRRPQLFERLIRLAIDPGSPGPTVLVPSGRSFHLERA
jgi:flavin-dependent dehydrogenase